MALKFITAEEAASFVHHDDNVGFSGFTTAGCPKVVPGAIAKKAMEEHEKGNLSINSENFLPIIKKWLYTDKDIFIREIVSNGCDAVTKHSRNMK